jgi:PTS system cellobiose-specific IIB component
MGNKKVNILLICVNAMSSGFMVERMKKAALERGLEIDIEAVAGWGFKEKDFSKLDLVMLSPQVRHYKKEVENIASKFNVPVTTIDFQTYGLVDGNKCLDLALNTLGMK